MRLKHFVYLVTHTAHAGAVAPSRPELFPGRRGPPQRPRSPRTTHLHPLAPHDEDQSIYKEKGVDLQGAPGKEQAAARPGPAATQAAQAAAASAATAWNHFCHRSLGRQEEEVLALGCCCVLSTCDTGKGGVGKVSKEGTWSYALDTRHGHAAAVLRLFFLLACRVTKERQASEAWMAVPGPCEPAQNHQPFT